MSRQAEARRAERERFPLQYTGAGVRGGIHPGAACRIVGKGPMGTAKVQVASGGHFHVPKAELRDRD